MRRKVDGPILEPSALLVLRFSLFFGIRINTKRVIFPAQAASPTHHSKHFPRITISPNHTCKKWQQAGSPFPMRFPAPLEIVQIIVNLSTELNHENQDSQQGLRGDDLSTVEQRSDLDYFDFHL